MFFLEHSKCPSEHMDWEINVEHINTAETQGNHGWEPLFHFSSAC